MLAEAAAFFVGLAFFDSSVVIPVLLAKLGASDTVIGLTRLVQTLGFTLPALFASHYIHGRARHLNFLLITTGIARFGLLTLPPILFFFGLSHPTFTLYWFLAIFTIFWVMDGSCAVSWFDICAKTIPARVRGRFFGLMQTLGGIGAVGASLVVAAVLKSPSLEFPRNFALLALCWCLCIAFSQALLFIIREPEGEVESGEERPSFMTFLKMIKPLLRDHPRLGRLIVTRIMLDGAGMAGPFYVLYAQRDLMVSLKMVGLYTLMLNIGKVLTGPFWGWVSDRHSPVIGLRLLGLTILLVPLLALCAGMTGSLTLPVAFFLMGASMEGVWMLTANALLETVTEKERPLAIGVMSVLSSPSAIYGPLGGFIAQKTTYPVVFLIALGITTMGFISALLMPRNPHARSRQPKTA